MRHKRKSPGPTETAASMSSAALIKRLASTDAKARNHALRVLLCTWLPSQARIPDEDMRRLWKGLFYCVWHSDKAPEQARLADRLSGMVLDLPAPLALEFFSAFLLTMRREWGGIDFLRLDKFYLLIRRFVRAGLALLGRNSWGLEMVGQVVGVLVGGTFLDSGNSKGNGVNYHVASVFLEEFKGFLPLRREVVEAVLVPFVGTVGRASDKVLVSKIKGCLFDELVKAGRGFMDAEGAGLENDDAGLLGPIALGLGFSSRFYELGSSGNCIQGNRKVVFGLHEVFLKLEKDCAALKVEVSFPVSVVEDDGDEEEIPPLVPIDNSASMEVDGSVSEEGMRARKKAKKGSGGSGKKDKKKNKKKSPGSNLVVENDSNIVADNGGNIVAENGSSNGNVEAIDFSDSVISDLRMQFEKVAKEVGLNKGVASCCDPDKVNVVDARVSKKRKRNKKGKGRGESQTGNDVELIGLKDGESTTCTTGEKSSKKVTFSMKNNLVWKPQNPLPPQDLRLPPSVTPRGSALKKGVPPGPIREAKRGKARARPSMKSRKPMRAVAPVLKRIKKLKSLPA